jgi:hypothetical protein
MLLLKSLIWSIGIRYTFVCDIQYPKCLGTLLAVVEANGVAAPRPPLSMTVPQLMALAEALAARVVTLARPAVALAVVIVVPASTVVKRGKLSTWKSFINFI